MKKILDAREKRWKHTDELLDEFDLPIITITINIPGEDKCKGNYLYAHGVIKRGFVECIHRFGLSILYFENRLNKDGPETFLIIDTDPKTLKKLAVQFEQSHTLGRISDIDIKDKNRVWSRIDLGLGERKCLLCENSARRCILSKRHSLKEVLLHIDKTIFDYRISGANKC